MQAVVHLERDELDLLLKLAGYYEKAMGPARHLVRLTSPRPVRARFAFLAAESRLLAGFAQETLQRMEKDQADSTDVKFTLPALVAFWGRLLASLASKRARRRMSAEEVVRRERLGAKLQEATAASAAQDPGAMEEVLATRRPTEAESMRQRLNLSA